MLTMGLQYLLHRRESQSCRGGGLESAICLSVCLDMGVGILHTDICRVSARSECWVQALFSPWGTDECGVMLSWEVCPALESWRVFFLFLNSIKFGRVTLLFIKEKVGY